MTPGGLLPINTDPVKEQSNVNVTDVTPQSKIIGFGVTDNADNVFTNRNRIRKRYTFFITMIV